MAIQARVLSGEKLGQLVCRLQRHSGRSRESCWRFVLQMGLKIRDEHRRWTEDELDTLREHIATHSVAETAKVLGRSVKSVRCALQRNELKVREIRCDWMSIESLARILHVRKTEIQSWIEKGWLEATVRVHGKRSNYVYYARGLSRSLLAPSQRSHLRRKGFPTWRCSRPFTTTASCPSTQSARNFSPFVATNVNEKPMRQSRRKTANSMRMIRSEVLRNFDLIVEHRSKTLDRPRSLAG